MRWTDKLPTNPGQYWVEGGACFRVVTVLAHENELNTAPLDVMDPTYPEILKRTDSECYIRWYGPLEPPKENPDPLLN